MLQHSIPALILLLLENVSRYLHSKKLIGCTGVGCAKDGGALLPAYRVHSLDPESSPA